VTGGGEISRDAVDLARSNRTSNGWMGGLIVFRHPACDACIAF